jgi:hypothetical protein
MSSIDAILACTHLEKFKDVRATLEDSDIDQLFDSCTSKDILSAKFNQRESKAVFMRMKAVSQNSDFI